MPRDKIRNWSGDTNDANYVKLVAALAQYPAELRVIVNAVMLAHHKSTGEQGINAFNGGHVKLSDNLRLYNYVKDYVGGTWKRGQVYFLVYGQ